MYLYLYLIKIIVEFCLYIIYGAPGANIKKNLLYAWLLNWFRFWSGAEADPSGDAPDRSAACHSDDIWPSVTSHQLT